MKTIFELHKLYEAKNKRTFTNKEMAALIGTGESTYSHLRAGRVNATSHVMSDKTKYKVANFFGQNIKNITWPTSRDTTLTA